MKSILLFLSFLFFFQTSYAGVKQVVCIGDSITEGYGIPVNKRKKFSFPAVLNKRLGDEYKVINLGHASRTLLSNNSFAWFKSYRYKQLMSVVPDIAIIMLGTNDSKLKFWKGNSKQFQADFEKLISVLKGLNSKVAIYVCLPLAAYDRSGKLSQSNEISGIRIRDEVIPTIKQVLNNHKEIRVIDTFTKTLNHSEFFSDGVHPNVSGAKYVADIIFESLSTN